MSKINASIKMVKAFAPATCANVAVGFDILGFAFEGVGDYVTLTKRKDNEILIESIEAKENLPFALSKNTASLVIQEFCRHLDLNIGFSIRIQKGIPLCSGMGGSAASAVAALVACNQFLASPLSNKELVPFALLGEKEASGEAHADNIVPCLFGGLTLIQSHAPLEIVNLPIPELYCVLLHPHLQVATRDARAALKREVTLQDHVKQSANLAAFIASLYEKDYDLLQKSMKDLVIEPQRAQFIPNFYQIQNAALELGALGMSYSGSGPALFAFARNQKDAEAIGSAMRLILQKHSIDSDYWIAPISKKAAHVVDEERT